MALLSAFTKVKGFFAPFTFSSTAASFSRPVNANRPQPCQHPTTPQKRGLQIDGVKTGRVVKSKANYNKDKIRRGLFNHSKILDEGGSHLSDHDPSGDILIQDGDSVVTTKYHDKSLVKIDFEEYVPDSDRFIQYTDPKFKAWASEEIWLFNKLSKRGYEPLMRLNWQLDFLSFPDNLFTKNEKLVHIGNLNTNISEGKFNLIAYPSLNVHD